MPGMDGTGPAGMGPMTGGARGWCNPYGAAYAVPGSGRAAYGGLPYRGVAAYPRRRYPVAAAGWAQRWTAGPGRAPRGRGRGGRGRGFR